jgi:hypothetical protein
MVQREFITRSGSLVAFVGAGASITARPRAKEIQLPLRPIRSAEVRQNAEWTVLHPDRVRQGLPGPGNHSRIRSGIARSAPLGIAVAISLAVVRLVMAVYSISVANPSLKDRRKGGRLNDIESGCRDCHATQQ